MESERVATLEEYAPVFRTPKKETTMLSCLRTSLRRDMQFVRGIYLLAICALFGVTTVGLAAPSYSFTNIDFPEATQTSPTGINDSSQIVGGYYDASGVAHGFLLNGGIYTSIDFPGAVGTQANGINSNGQIVGIFLTCIVPNSYGCRHPFSFSGGVYTALPEAPGSMPGTTSPSAINQGGQIAGWYVDPCFCKTHGFLLNGGVFTTIDDPSFFSSEALGINDSGKIVGVGQQVWGGGNAHGYLLSGGVFTAIDFPVSGASTVAAGINNLGDVVGYYASPGNPLEGFLLSGGTYTTISYPGAAGTSIPGPGINSAGQIVGEADTSPEHGFLATPTSTPLYSVCLLYDPTKAVKSGATIPIKLQLCNSSGANLSSSSIVVHAISVTQVSTSISGPVEDSGNANPDNDFRYDSTLGTTGGYIFNLNTKGFTTGTYSLNFKAGNDPTTYQVSFQVK